MMLRAWRRNPFTSAHCFRIGLGRADVNEEAGHADVLCKAAERELRAQRGGGPRAADGFPTQKQSPMKFQQSSTSRSRTRGATSWANRFISSMSGHPKNRNSLTPSRL